jgi:hypothetical protein
VAFGMLNWVSHHASAQKYMIYFAVKIEIAQHTRIFRHSMLAKEERQNLDKIGIDDLRQ